MRHWTQVQVAVEGQGNDTLAYLAIAADRDDRNFQQAINLNDCGIAAGLLKVVC